MGCWVVGEYWLIIHSFNEIFQAAIINIYKLTYRNMKLIHFNPEVTISVR